MSSDVPTKSVPSPGPPGPPYEGIVRVDVQPPTSLYVARDDRLYVRVRGSVVGKTLEVRLRLMLPDGQVVPQLVTVPVPSDRSTTLQVIELAEGFLLGAAAGVGPAPVAHGSVYVEVGITHEVVPTPAIYQVLLSGYLSDGDAIGWPWGDPLSPVGLLANLRSIAGVAPAAGAEIITVVPANASWRLLTWRATLTTAAAVANRRTHLVVDDGVTILYDAAAFDVQTATLVRNINAGFDGFQRAAQDNELYIPVPEGLILRAGFRIRTLTTLIAGADQYGAPQLLVEEFLEA